MGRWWPADPEARWNRVIIYVGVAFAVWVVLIVLGQIFGDNKDLGDDALLIGAAAGFLTILLNQFHHGRQIERVVDAVNHVDDRLADAERLRNIDAKLDELLERLGGP